MDSLSIKVNIGGRVYPLTIDPKEEESIRKAAESINNNIKELQNNYAVRDTQDLFSQLGLDDYRLVALEITENGKELTELLWKANQKIAIVIGSERHGISKESLQAIQESFHIKQFGRTGSINVGNALSIVLFHLTNQC